MNKDPCETNDPLSKNTTAPHRARDLVERGRYEFLCSAHAHKNDRGTFFTKRQRNALHHLKAKTLRYLNPGEQLDILKSGTTIAIERRKK